MENNNKSQAEIYREERKARLAKAAAKKSKRSPTFSKTKKIIGKVIAVVLVVAICFGAVGAVLNFFGTPQKVLKVKAADKELSFTLAEFNYYYYAVWSQVSNMAYQYEYQYSQYLGQSGYGVQLTGYDYTQSPASQEYKDDFQNVTGITLKDLGQETATWADVMKYAAISQLIQAKYTAKLAKEAGLSVTADDQKEIDEGISSIADAAKKQDYSLDRYLRQAYGNGVTEKLLRRIQEDQALADAYLTKFAEDTQNGVTDEQINKIYAENPENYNIVSLRAYPFSATYDEKADDAAKETARKQAKALADSFLAGVTTEESFLKLAQAELKKDSSTKDTDPATATALANATKSYITSNISEEAATWALSTDRKVGDKTLVKAGDDDFFVLLVTVAPHKDTAPTTNDLRHILFKFPEVEKGKELTDAQKAAVKAKAQAVLDEYLKNPTEKNFIDLTNKHSEDVDSEGKVNNAGIYTDVTADSNYVTAFKNWGIENGRKVGDTGIVETEYGYHIMYSVNPHGETWKETIKTEILNDATNKLIEEIDTNYIDTINMNNPLLKWAFNAQSKHINTILARSASADSNS